jgi:hypothetical protein
MFHIQTICADRAEFAATRVSDAYSAVHSFVANASVNSPLYCWVLDAERGRLRKSLCARHNGLLIIAWNACAITTPRSITFVENILLSRVRYGVFANVGRLARTPVREFAPRMLSGCLDAFCFTQRRCSQKIKEDIF